MVRGEIREKVGPGDMIKMLYMCRKVVKEQIIKLKHKTHESIN